MSSWPVRVMVGSFLVTVAFVGGSVAGSQHQPAAPPPKVVQVPKYIQPSTKVVTKTVMPQACKDAIAAAAAMQAATDKYEQQVGDLPNLITETGVAIQQRDLKKLNTLQEQQSKMQGASIQALLDIREAQQTLDRLQPKCNEATK